MGPANVPTAATRNDSMKAHDTRSVAPQTSASNERAAQPDSRAAAAQPGSLQAFVDGSPRMVAQRLMLQSVFGSAFQYQADEPSCHASDAPVQGMAAGPPRAAPSESSMAATDEKGIPGALRTGLESLSGVDLSDVRVHRNSSQPAQMKALAYAQGNDIHLGPGQERHLPHEAWHVVQQRQGRVRETARLAGNRPVNDDPTLETEADVFGARAASESHAGSSRSGGLNRSASASTDSKPVIQGLFTPAVKLKFADAQKEASAPKSKIDAYTIKTLNLPENDRPNTQFGKDQKSHTVSWTLLVGAYRAAVGKPLATFVADYLVKDWKALRAQHDERPSSKLKGYLERYSESKLTEARSEERTDMEWQSYVQRSVADYFIAMQLAPFSTHGVPEPLADGYIADTAGTHGEPGANKYLSEMESGVLPASSDGVLKYASKYVDTSRWHKSGIRSVKGVVLIFHKWEKSLERRFPKLWTAYSSELREHSDEHEIPVDLRAGWGATLKRWMDLARSEKFDQIQPTSGPISTIDVVAQDPADGETFMPQVMLERPGADAGAEGITGSECIIDQLNVPDDRPATKYGPGEQASHTVAWTLFRRAIERGAAGKTLREFVEHVLLTKWQMLAAQMWGDLLARNLIIDGRKATRDKNNQLNQDRLGELFNRIDPSIVAIQAISLDKKATILEWAATLQTLVRDYCEVMQSSPLATHRIGKPDGNGESDANRWLDELEDASTVSFQDSWQTKFVSEVEKSFSPSKFASSHPAAYAVYNKLKPKVSDKANATRMLADGVVLSDSDKLIVGQFLVPHMAAKYLDAQWSDAVYTPQDKAMICYEWERSLAEAYPEMWEVYGANIKAYSDALEISPSKRALVIKLPDGDKVKRVHRSMAIEMADIRAAPEAYGDRVYEFWTRESEADDNRSAEEKKKAQTSGHKHKRGDDDDEQDQPSQKFQVLDE